MINITDICNIAGKVWNTKSNRVKRAGAKPVNFMQS